MGEGTLIEWADDTFNAWRWCRKVSPGCANCYAEAQSLRNPAVLGQWGPGKPRVRASEAMWRQPLKWNQEARALGTRRRVFCASMADWLDEEVPAAWLFDLLSLIHKTPDLDWLLLTKRPENWNARLRAAAAQCTIDPLDVTDRIYAWLEVSRLWNNVWIGVSVEDQARAEERHPLLMQIPARVRFWSAEPLLEGLDVSDLWDQYEAPSWVIAGGESGPKSRPMHPQWVQDLRDRCIHARVPFLFKQWGEWFPGMMTDHGDGDGWMLDADHGGDAVTALVEHRGLKRHEFPAEADGTYQEMFKVGKKAAGRVLDGREWSEFPLLTGGR